MNAWRHGPGWALLLCLLMIPAWAVAAPPRDLDAGWEYRWGDSPRLADGSPA
ncbi:hypothetical protein [Bisbaumannia pacifica]|uniref:hypothetical protein n=1 Tax=Bisbaumannia pacifica TaxID=77098 RepID=UPI001E386C28|nr:hypothetical protein [Halomonas pacifica]